MLSEAKKNEDVLWIYTNVDCTVSMSVRSSAFGMDVREGEKNMSNPLQL